MNESKFRAAYLGALLARHEGEESPRNPFICDAAEAGLDCLILQGWISDYSGKLQGLDAVYTGLGSIDLRQVTAMAATLARVQKQLAKDCATEPGDVFVSFAKALGCTWIATARGPYSMYADTGWIYDGILSGRNELRWLIQKLEAEAAPAVALRREREAERARAREAVS